MIYASHRARVRSMRELGGDFDVFNSARRLRIWRAILAKAIEVKLDRLPNGLLGILWRSSRCDTAGQIRNIGREIAACHFNDYRVSH